MGGLVRSRRSPAPAATFRTPLRDEPFLTSTNISSVVSLSYAVNRPTKSGSNPFFTTSPTSKYDHHLVWTTAVRKRGGPVELFNSVLTSDWNIARLAKAWSPDGVNFSRPIVGSNTADGDTNNSVLLDSGSASVRRVFAWVSYEPSLSTPYLAIGDYAPDGFVAPFTTARRKIWSSPDGITFTVAKDIDQWGNGAGYIPRDASSLTKRSDGTWIAHYQSYPSSERRSVGAITSATSSLSGTWTDQGTLATLTSTSTSVQYYMPKVWREGDVMLMSVCMFNGNNQNSASASGMDDRIYKFELWASAASDGLTWTQLDSHWVDSGSGAGSDDTISGEWDWGCITPCGAPVRVGNNYRFYYCGQPAVHHPYPNSTSGFTTQWKIGSADVGYQRIGQLGGSGEVVLSTVTGTNATTLTINCTGTVKVELLDGSNNVITGYSQTDCETIPSDTYGHTVKWAGVSRTPSSYKAKIYVTSGTVHRVTVYEAP